MTTADVNIETSTTDISFDTLGLHPKLLRAVQEMGYQRPTPIQALSIPAGLAGKDVLASAQTGSGKTAAFVLPILQRLIQLPRGTTRALVLAPTRELAAQIEESARGLAKHTDIRVASVFGGVGMNPQERAFRNGTDLIVATPGRLLDHMQHTYVNFRGLQVLVLDEADRMLDMGFLPDIRRVLRGLPSERQTMFYSATLPDPIQKLSADMLRHPVSVGVARKSAPASGVTQMIYPVAEELKTDLLLALLRGEGAPAIQSVIVFTRTKHRANRLAEKLMKAGVPAERIHGNRSQSARTEALAGFKSGKYRVLVATDIAARGIDVEALGHVINFDVPNVPEDYVHRVGRTARAEMTGEALTFVSPAEETDLKAIERAVNKRLERVTLPDFDYRARPRERFEVPIQERIAEIRSRKAEDRARAAAKAERKGSGGASGAPQQPGRGGQGGGRSQSGARSSTQSSAQSSGPRNTSSQPSNVGGGRVGPQAAGRGRRGGSR